jgi:hypothetical protein
MSRQRDSEGFEVPPPTFTDKIDYFDRNSEDVTTVGITNDEANFACELTIFSF